MATDDIDIDDESVASMTIRQRLRKATGFSFTALRNTLRGLTGFSFTALRASLRAATGISLTAIRISVYASTCAVVRNTMKFMLAPLPPWARYFAQPFMVAYYIPLLLINVNPSKRVMRERRAKMEAYDEKMKEAVKTAQLAQNGGYWPVRLNDEEEIEPVAPEGGSPEDVDISAAIVDSFNVMYSLQGTAKE